MDLLYLDHNCFQRAFDDLRQVRIQLEALACQDVFMRAEKGLVRLAWSFMHEDELDWCPFPKRQAGVQTLLKLCSLYVSLDNEIERQALQFEHSAHLSAKDSLHLAAAESVGTRHLLTCDDDFIRRAGKLKTNTRVMNPLQYVQEYSA